MEEDVMASPPSTETRDTTTTEATHTLHNGTGLEDNSSTSCGLGKYSPEWLQGLASKKTYVLVYGMLGMNNSAIGSYFIGTISTIEKRFRLPSSTSGIIASSWDFGALCTVLLLTYFGSGGHKTRWVAFCALFAGISCFLRYLPYLLYGANTDSNLSTKNPSYDLCSGSSEDRSCSLNFEGLMTSVILTLAHIGLGIGTSTYNTLGAAYLDDNSVKDKAPFLFSLATCFRNLGPTVGFLFASYALKKPETSDDHLNYDTDDQRWIGAWHLGWIPLGTMHLVLAVLMAFFPKTLPREALRRKLRKTIRPTYTKKNWSLNDLKYKLGRLLRNRVLMCNALSSTSYMFGAIGFWIFMPKYIETQFMQSASRANFITGTVGLICTLLGAILSGSYISRFKPHPRYLAGWSFVTKVLHVIVHLTFAFISCEKGIFHGVSQNSGRLDLLGNCNMVCECSPERYSPVCDVSQLTTFFSPCHAGCMSVNRLNGTTVFGDCSCVRDSGTVTEGACPTSCTNHFFIFLTLLCFLKFLLETGRPGNTIIQYRSVDPCDKSLSIALTEILICGLAFIPAPIIYGFILDSTCLIWGEECGKKGNCLLYDEKKLRYYLNFTASGFLFLSALLDFGVFKSVKMLNIYDDEASPEDEVTQKLNSNKQNLMSSIKN